MRALMACRAGPAGGSVGQLVFRHVGGPETLEIVKLAHLGPEHMHHDVTGVDQFSWMIDAARAYASEADFRAEFIASDFRSFTADPRFDIVYTSCWMYSTCQGTERRRELLEQCLRQTTSDGLIVVSTVDASVGSRLTATIRFVLAKLTAVVTLGNLHTEIGERIYQGLFWHHLSEATVRNEIRSCGLIVVDTVRGSGIEPCFYILARASSKYAETSS